MARQRQQKTIYHQYPINHPTNLNNNHLQKHPLVSVQSSKPNISLDHNHQCNRPPHHKTKFSKSIPRHQVPLVPSLHNSLILWIDRNYPPCPHKSIVPHTELELPVSTFQDRIHRVHPCIRILPLPSKLIISHV